MIFVRFIIDRSTAYSSRARLETVYVDLLLIHFPGANDAIQSPTRNRKRREDTWRALENAKAQGQVSGSSGGGCEWMRRCRMYVGRHVFVVASHIYDLQMDSLDGYIGGRLDKAILMGICTKSVAKWE